MKTRKLLPLFFILLTIIINIGCQSEVAKASIYYVSNKGNDNANGRSPETAWKTIDKVNSRKFVPGDSILFEAGSTWRNTLRITESGKPGQYIVYSRYGKGKNPEILGSKKTENWFENATSNVWQSKTSLKNVSDEYYPGRIFFVINDSVAWGEYVPHSADLSNLKNEFDYTVNGSIYYVYADTDPDIRYNSIEVTQRSWCIRMLDLNPENYIEFNGINFRFSKMEGFEAGYPAMHGATDLIFRNCTIGYIGSKGSGCAYGIQAWHSNLLVENCIITDCGRRGISINLYLQRPPGEYRNINNIVIRNNIFKRGYHTTSLDLACTNITGDTIQNVYFYNNYIDDSEVFMTKDNQASNQIFTQSGSSFMNNVYIYCNIFVRSTARNILIEGGDSIYIWNNTIVGHNQHLLNHPYSNVGLNYPLHVDYRNNILYDNLPDNNIQNHGVMMYYKPSGFMAKDYNLYFSLFPKNDRNFACGYNDQGLIGYYNTQQWSWSGYLLQNKKFDQNSPKPQNPLFVSLYDNIGLKEGSPAIGAGIQIDMIKKDFYGNPMNNPPDLGAIQFGYNIPETKK